MRVLICGDRNWTNVRAIEREIDLLKAEYGYDLVIIEGEARGADSLARNAAKERNIEVERYPAEWDRYGRAAGAIRNTQMLKEGKPSLVLAFHENIEESRGTKNMVTQARKAGVETRVFDS
jgi:hypothetical protein